MEDRLFRDAMGRFATGVTVVTTELDGSPHGMTANAFVSVSLNPKLVLVSVDKKGKILPKIQLSKKYAVSILSKNQEYESMRFSGQLKDEKLYRFERFENLPVIKDAIAVITCNLYQEVDTGDHILFIGEVTNLRVHDEDPLVYFKGKYRELK